MQQRHRRTRAIAVAALILASGVTAYLALVSAPHGVALAPWWPPAGLALGALLLCRREQITSLLPLVAAAVFVGNLCGGHGVGLSAALALADATETGVIAALVLREGFPWRLRTLEDAWEVTRASLVGVSVGAALITLISTVLTSPPGLSSPAITLGQIFLSHLSSIAVLLPLILCLAETPNARVPYLEAIAQATAVGGLTGAMFWFDDAMAFTWLPIVGLVWAAVRLGTRITVLEVWVVATALQWAIRTEQGPFVGSMSWTAATVVGEAYAIGLVLTSIPLALVQDAHRRTVADLRDKADDLAHETRFRQAVLDATADLVMVVRHNGDVVSVNRTCAELTGYSGEELIGGGWRRLTPPEHREHSAERWRQIREHSGVDVSDGIEMEICVRDGSRRRVLVRSLPLTDADDVYVVVGLDITEARNAAGWLMHILRTPSTTAIIGCDLRGEVLIFSRGAEILTGALTADVVGHPVTELLHDPDTAVRPGTVEELVGTPARVGGEPCTRDWMLGRQRGSRVLASLTVSVIHDAYGAKIGYLVVGQDITAEREAARRLEELDAARHEFVSTASHEIRTPMTSVIGYTELLADGSSGALTVEQQTLVDAISRNGHRLLGLADELLTVARFDSGAPAAATVRLDLAAVLGAAMHSYSGAAQAGGITMSSHLPRRPVYVEGNASDIERVLVNLISNAVKFTPRGGTVECALLCRDDTAVVSVHDTGIGIPAADLPRVFDRFYRSDNAVRGAVQGTGLGLSIAVGILEERGGSLEVESVEGEGSTFTVRLPLAP